MPDELSDAQLEQRRTAAKTHGAFSYLARTEDGDRITADMGLVESAVVAEVEAAGPRARVRKQAIRFATAADLLWGHMLTGPEEFVAGLTKWGWLAGAEIRAWLNERALKDSGDEGDAGAVLEAVKREQTQ